MLFRSTAAGGEVVARVDANRVREATGYPIGGVPPLGHATSLRTFMDENLLGFDIVWAAAGTPHHVFRVLPGRLAEVTGARIAELAAG